MKRRMEFVSRGIGGMGNQKNVMRQKVRGGRRKSIRIKRPMCIMDEEKKKKENNQNITSMGRRGRTRRSRHKAMCVKGIGFNANKS